MELHRINTSSGHVSISTSGEQQQCAPQQQHARHRKVLLVNPSINHLISPLQEQDKTYIAAFQDVTCKSDVIAYPTSTTEVADQIATHVAAAKTAGVQLKVRASHK
jgi:hypothetical protein